MRSIGTDHCWVQGIEITASAIAEVFFEINISLRVITRPSVCEHTISLRFIHFFSVFACRCLSAFGLYHLLKPPFTRVCTLYCLYVT